MQFEEIAESAKASDPSAGAPPLEQAAGEVPGRGPSTLGGRVWKGASSRQVLGQSGGTFVDVDLQGSDCDDTSKGPGARRRKEKVPSRGREETCSLEFHLIQQQIRFKGGTRIGEQESSGSERSTAGDEYERTVRAILGGQGMDGWHVGDHWSPTEHMEQLQKKSKEMALQFKCRHNPKNKSAANGGFLSFQIDAITTVADVKRVFSRTDTTLKLCHPNITELNHPQELPVICEISMPSSALPFKLLQLECVMCALKAGGVIENQYGEYKDISPLDVICAVVSNKQELEIMSLEATFWCFPELRHLDSINRLWVLFIPSVVPTSKVVQLEDKLEQAELAHAAAMLKALQAIPEQFRDAARMAAEDERTKRGRASLKC